MSEFVEVVTTVERGEDAERIAQLLVEERLAACVQISGPIGSTYRWRGAVEKAQEWHCTAKTRSELFPLVEQAIKSVHPYEVPEIIATPIVAASADYLAWLKNETRDP